MRQSGASIQSVDVCRRVRVGLITIRKREERQDQKWIGILDCFHQVSWASLAPSAHKAKERDDIGAVRHYKERQDKGRSCLRQINASSEWAWDRDGS